MDNDDLTAQVLARTGAAADPRMVEFVRTLVPHLHAFVREFRPTQDEWATGIAFLTETGQRCDATRQEFILLSDVLGVSMLVDEINNVGLTGVTESTVLGPFHVDGAPHRELGADIGAGGGRPLVVAGTVRSSDGAPLAGAELDVWQADSEGYYDVQRTTGGTDLRARFTCAADGTYWFRTRLPKWYAIPDDGPVGKLLRTTDRHPNRPAHIHFIASAPAHRPVTTHAFLADSPYLDSDAVFGVKAGLIRPVETIDDAAEAARFDVSAPFELLRFDISLAGVSSRWRQCS